MTSSIPIVNVVANGQLVPDGHYWLNDYNTRASTGVPFQTEVGSASIVVEYGLSDVLNGSLLASWIGIQFVEPVYDEYQVTATLADTLVLENASFTFELVYFVKDKAHTFDSGAASLENIALSTGADLSSLSAGFFLHINILELSGTPLPAGRLYYADVRADIPAGPAGDPAPVWLGWNDGYPDDLPFNVEYDGSYPYGYGEVEQPAVPRFINMRTFVGDANVETYEPGAPLPMRPLIWDTPDNHQLALAATSYLCAPAEQNWIPVNRQRIVVE